MATEKVFEKNCCACFLSFLFILCILSFTDAAEIYVYPTVPVSPAGTLAGISYSSQTAVVMYPNIQSAIDAAVDGDIIYLAPGRYKGDGNRDLDFNGKAITLSGLDPNDSNVVAATIIDCNGTETENHRGFYFHTGEDVNSVICGITITNGYVIRYASAIYSYQSSPYIHHCNIVSNYSSSSSAVYLGNSSSIFADNTISDNNVTSAIYAYGASSNYVQIKNCVIKNNFSNNYCYGIYGGDYIKITNCKVGNNSGNGIYMRGSRDTTVSGCFISGNGSTKYQSSAAGVYRCSLIEDSVIIENFGAGITNCQQVRNCFIGYNSGNGLYGCNEIVNSKIIGNNGVGIYSPYTTVSNCIIAKNKKQGIYYPYGSITNCTIIDNNSAGIQLSGSTVKITNCIIRDNYLEQIKNVTSSTTISYTNSYEGVK